MSLSIPGRLVMTGVVLLVLTTPRSIVGASEDAPLRYLRAQGPAQASVAHDPDVLGAERLFTAWVEGQILNRESGRRPDFGRPLLDRG